MNKINHVAFIMDGNGRWAKARGLERHFGHKKGCERVIEIYEGCREENIKAMSLYAFSTENWNRPQDEINYLFSYLEDFFRLNIERLKTEGCQVRVSGDISKLPKKTQAVINEAISLTQNNKDFVFNICLNYGGKDEIIRACKLIYDEINKGKLDLNNVDNGIFENHLYTVGLPPVDLLIRTSGEMRTSNFMLWQLAYSEFVFTKVRWPDFDKKQLKKCFKQYYKRDRRFGRA